MIFSPSEREKFLNKILEVFYSLYYDAQEHKEKPEQFDIWLYDLLNPLYEEMKRNRA
jgi:hypothetical protein